MSKNCQTGEFSIRGETLAREEKENLGDTFFWFSADFETSFETGF